MALKAGYYGVKKNVMDELEQLDGAKIIKSVGAGLNFSAQGALSCKSATASQAGIAKSTDYIGSDITITVPLFKTIDTDTGAISGLSIIYDNEPDDDTSTNLISSKAVYDALKDYVITDTETGSVTIGAGSNTTVTPTAKAGYEIIGSDIRIVGAGSTAYAYLIPVGDPFTHHIGNRSAEDAYTWSYSITTVYRKTYA